MKKEIIFLILIVSLLLIGCTTSRDISVNTNSPISVVTNTQVNNQTPVANLKEFTVHGSSFKFDPSEIKVKKGDRVKINFISDDVGHNLLIDELNVRTRVLSGGNAQSIEFVADKEGSFDMYCSVGSHRDLGMVGKFIVEA